MSTLLVDMGNSRLKWALADGGVPRNIGSLTHRDHDLSELLSKSWAGLDQPQRVFVASVAAAGVRDQLEAWLRRHWDRQPDFLVSPARDADLINSYAEPARLGCDRWAAMVAARHQSRSAFCVVDCGTAVTIDVVDAAGQHLGGYILPGIHAMLQCLGQTTTLNVTDLDNSDTATLGTSTQAAVQAGVVQAIAALVEQTVSERQPAGAVTMRCILTGGDAGRIAPLLKIPYEQQANLVLEGLAVLAQSKSAV